MRFENPDNPDLGCEWLREDVHEIVDWLEGGTGIQIRVEVQCEDRDEPEEMYADLVVDYAIPVYEQIEQCVHEKLRTRFLYKGRLTVIELQEHIVSDSEVHDLPMLREIVDLDIMRHVPVVETGKGCVPDLLVHSNNITIDAGAVSPAQLVSICQQHKVRCAVYGLDGKEICSTIPAKRNSRRNSIAVVCANKHAYLMNQAHTARTLRRGFVVTSRRSRETVFLCKRDLEEKYLSSDTHILTTLRCREGVLTCFTQDGTTYRLGDPAHGGNLMALGFDEFVPLLEALNAVQGRSYHFPVVCMPRACDAPVAHVPFAASFAPVCADTRAFDVRRCYTNALRGEIPIDWSVPCEFDEIEDYDGRPLGPGRYLVDTANSFPAQGRGWYYYGFLVELRRMGVHFEVERQQRFRDSAPHDAFEPFVRTIEDALESCYAKKYINMFIGGCKATRRNVNTYAVTTTSQEEAIAYKRKMFPARMRQLGRYYLVWPVRTLPYCGDRSYIYEQVLERSWLLLYRCWVHLNRLPIVYIYTDCIAVRGYTGETPPGCREETAKPHAVFKRRPMPALEVVTWNEAPDTSGSFMVTGPAGSGKTRFARDIVLLRDRVAVMCPTNRAASEACSNAVTFHRFFNLTADFSDAELTCDAIRGVARRVDTIWVDEFFMAQEWQLRCLLKLSRLGINVVLSGDHEQLPAVGCRIMPEEILRSSLLVELVRGNHVRLTGAYRSSCVSNERKPTRRHVAYTNAMCDTVNARVHHEMMRLKRDCLVVNLDTLESSVVRNSANALETERKLCRGTLLIWESASGPMLKNDIGEVTGWDQRRKCLTVHGDYGVRDVPFADVRKTSLAYCLTIHKIQGATIHEDYTVHELDKMKRLSRSTDTVRASLGKRLMYVATTRAASGFSVYLEE